MIMTSVPMPKCSLFLSIIAIVALAGCATPPVAPQPRTTVVLLPDEDGHVGSVSVSGDGASQTVDQAYNFTTVEGVHGKPSGMNAMDQDSVAGIYQKLIAAQPLRPAHFTLNFINNKTVLTEESKAQIAQVMDAIRTRKPTEISIFGHTDSTGTDSYNMQLSAERAKAVATLLRKHDPTLDRIEIKFFGDREPLVKSDGRTAEPRNRRAEVMVL